MSPHFIYNGKTCKAGTLVAGPASRGIRYGDGVFETMKMVNGVLLHADEHFARLWQGLSVLRFELPRQFEPSALQQQVEALAAKNSHSHAARIRLMVFRGDGGLYDAKSHAPQYVIETLPLPEGNGAWNSNGLVLGIFSDARKSCDVLANIKHNNYLPYVLAALEAKKEKWNDALLLNIHGRVCDSTIANFFMIKDDHVYTPALAEGCVAGVMRRHLLGLMRANGINVTETAISTGMLNTADEVFLTNAIYNLRWVQSVNDKQYGNTFTRKIYGLLQSTI